MKDQDQDRHPLRWQIAAIGAALWTITAILGWLVWEASQ